MATWRDGVSQIAGGRHFGATRAGNVTGSDSNEMKQYFSDSSAKFDPYESFPQANFSLGQVTQQRSPQLTEILERWTLFENANIFSAILPIVKTDNLKICTERVTFLPTIAQRTAERARPRTVESKRSTIRDVLERNAIGMELNFAMLNTPEGRRIYQMGLAQMRSAVEEANALHVITELMECFSPYRDFDKRYGQSRGRSLKEIMEDEAFYFGIFQRVDGAFEHLDSKISSLQKVYRGKGNTYVMHKKLLTYTTQIPAQNTEYWIGGPEAVKTFKRGAEGVTTDGRGNVIVTVETYMVDNMRPLDPLKRYIQYGEYNEFRDLKRGGDYSKHYDKERWIGIYNVDDDKWSVIDTAYVIDNCCRFDEKTGEPLGMYDSRVARHTINYDSDQIQDSYHYLGRNNRNEPVLLPCRYMGQISSDAIRTTDIRTHADVSIEKMVDINRNYTSGQIKTTIDNGLEALSYIEKIEYNAESDAFIKVARDFNVRSHGASASITPSEFSSQFQVASFGQNAHSGWDLPRVDAVENRPAWEGKMLLPIGYGSPNGFLSIAAAFEEAGSPAVFAANTGFNGEMGRKVFAFTRLLQEYVAYARTFYAGSPALSERAAAPWYHRPTAFHTLWDSVIVPQHRLPYHVLVRSDKSAGSKGDAERSASSRLQSLIGKSTQAIKYFEDRVVGRAAKIEDIQRRFGSGGGEDLAAFINADLSGASRQGGKRVVFDPLQRTNQYNRVEDLLKFLPAFAQVRYSGGLWASNPNSRVQVDGQDLRLLVLGEELENASAQLKSIYAAYDLIVGLIHNVAQEPTDGDLTEAQVKRETARALLLTVLSFARIEDVRETMSEEAQATIAKRILKIYADVISGHVTIDRVTGARAAQDVRQSILDSFRVEQFIGNFSTHASSSLATADTYYFKTADDVKKAVAYLRKINTSHAEILEELRTADGGARAKLSAAQVAFDAADYMSSPLLYSPSQLISHHKFITEGDRVVPAALLADTVNPAAPMNIANETIHTRLVKAVMQQPNDQTASNVDPHLMPLGMELEAQVRNISILSHMERAKRHRADMARARNQAASDRTGGPGSYGRSYNPADRDGAANDVSMGGSRSGGVSIPQVARKRTYASEAPVRSTGNSTFRDVPDLARPSDEDDLEPSNFKRLRNFGGLDPSLPDMFITSNFVKNWRAIDSDRSKGLLNNWTAKLYLMTPFNSKVLKTWASSNLLVPIRALLFRFASLGTYSIIKVQAGPETGFTYMAFPMFSWTNDGVNNVYYSQFNYHIKAKVEKLENVFHADNVFIDEYLGGFGIIPVGWDDTTPIYTANDTNPRRPSVYVSLEPYASSRASYESCLSITGVQKDAFGRFVMDVRQGPQLDFDNAVYFNLVYGHQEAVLRDRVSEASISDSSTFVPGSSPVVAYAGATKYWNAVEQDYTKTSPARGFIPTSWYTTGMRDVLNGRMARAPNATHNLLTQ